MFFTTFVDLVPGKAETLSAPAPLSLTDLVQLMIPGSDQDLYHAFAVHAKLITKPIQTIVGVLFAAAAHPDEHSRQGSLRRMVKCLVEVSNVLSSFELSFLLFSWGLDRCVRKTT